MIKIGFKKCRPCLGRRWSTWGLAGLDSLGLPGLDLLGLPGLERRPPADGGRSRSSIDVLMAGRSVQEARS